MASCLTVAPSKVPGFPGDDPATVFPLRLTPFEKFVLWDERPHQPMTCFIELYFALPLDHDKLVAALTTCVHRNPLLASRVVEREGDLWWEYDPLYKPQLLSPNTNPPVRDGWPIPIDLHEECGSRYWYGPTKMSCSDGDWKLMIQFHHACSDGVGMRRVVIDTLIGYAYPLEPTTTAVESKQASSSAEVPPGQSRHAHSDRWEKLAVGLLVDRFDFSNLHQGPAKLPLTTWQRIKNAHYFHFRLPVALRGTVESDEQIRNNSNGEPVRHAMLSREKSQEILEKSRQSQVGINELALTLLFQACTRWNRERGDTRNSHIRLLMPFELRSRIDLRMPAANRLSFSFLGRNYAQCEDFASLLSSIQAEIKSIKDSRLPLDFLDALKLGASHPRLMKWVIQRNRRMATAVLTYAGDMSRGAKSNRYLPEHNGTRIVGDSQMTNSFATPPVREHTNISMWLGINWGQLCFSIAWNRAAMSTGECEQFLNSYVDSWLSWLEAK